MVIGTFFSLGTASTGRHSIASNLTRPDGDDDGDSLAEYGEGDTGKCRDEERIFFLVFLYLCFRVSSFIYSLLFFSFFSV